MAVRKGLGDRAKRHDAYHRQAKGGGYRARSVFKLKEIDEKHRLLSKGDAVLDLGCFPGSWLQYASERTRGRLVGVDRSAVDLALPNFRMIAGDVFEMTRDQACSVDHPEGNRLEPFNVVLSDMAPDTTGIRHVDQSRSEALFEHALHIGKECLTPGGHFLGKLFMGPDFHRLITQCRKDFDKVRIVKPAGSRAQSIEQYVLAMGLKRSHFSDQEAP